MNGRRVLTMPLANTREAAEGYKDGYKDDPLVTDPQVEQVNGRWAVTAAKKGAAS